MKILIIGGGGREHALAWKIAQSPQCTKLFCAPGNPGISRFAQCVPLSTHGDFSDMLRFCREQGIGLVVVGPERPLAEGIADALNQAEIKVFGPNRKGAQLEASKRFAKELMLEAGIPTGAAATFTKTAPALAYLATQPLPIVIKATGLAEGKGVTVARTLAEAEAAVRQCLESRIFGEAGSEVLIEEFLAGEEASLLAFTDGKVIKPMDTAQDHKPVFDGDEGPNTGGMGSYSPAPVVTPEIYLECEEKILKPTLAALQARGIDYRGVIYAGLMITAQGPKVIEFNCRFGDPETQALLPRLKTDLVEVMLACVEGRLGALELAWTPEAAVCIVATSGGYPGPYSKNKVIKGLEKVPENGDVMVFQAGTTSNDRGDLLTSGGRVLGVTVKDTYLRVAIERAYEIMKLIKFDGMHYRSDIGRRALDRERG